MSAQRPEGAWMGAERLHVVTCFLMRGGRVLLLRRSRRVGTYRGLWAGVSGYIDAGEMPLERALKEIREETGLLEESLRLVRSGGRILVPAGAGPPDQRAKPGLEKGAGTPRTGAVLIVHPFLFEVRSGRIKLDWEHTEHRWVRPGELGRFRTVPALKEALESVLEGGGTATPLAAPRKNSPRAPHRSGGPAAGRYSASVKSLSSSSTSKSPRRAPASSQP